MEQASRDQNHITSALGVSSSDATSTLRFLIDPLTGRLLVDIAGGGTGDVVGPASSTDNAIARWDGVTGKLLQNSAVTIADTTGNMAGVGTINTFVLPSSNFVGISDSQTLTNKTINGANNTLTVRLANDVTGNLPVTNLNSGTSASSATFWRGDGTWATPAASGDVVGPSSSVDNTIARFDGTTGKIIQGYTSGGPTVSDTGAITATQGGSLTGTWSSLGTVTTIDINGGTVDGTIIGGAAAAAGTFTTLVGTTVNGNTITTGTGVLTIAAAKTLTVSNSLTLAGTDGTVMTFPATSASIARTDAANTFTGIQTFSTPIATASVATMTATVGGGVPTPPNNTTTFLRGDGTFATPAGGGDVSGPASSVDNTLVRFDSTTGKVIQGYTSGGPTASDTGALTATQGGSLTGTWSDLGTVTTIDINGGTVDGTVIGGAAPAAGTFTTLVAGSTTSLLLGTAGSAVGNIGFRNGTSGTITLAPVAGALGTVTLTLPAATDTVAVLAASQAFTNKTYNGNTWTAGTGVLTIAASKTLTANNSITLAGTDSTTMTFPTTTATIARTDAGQTFTGVQTMTSPAITTANLTGTQLLAENASIGLDPAGSADGKYTGITITAVAGYAQTYGDLVYLAVADSRWEKADADALATAGNVMLAMVVVAGGSDGAACTLLLQGQIRADAAFPALTIGAGVYVGETAGAIQVAIPTGADNIIRVVGFALTADEIYFNPSNDWQVTVA